MVVSQPSVERGAGPLRPQANQENLAGFFGGSTDCRSLIDSGKEELVEDAQGNKAVGYVTMTLLQNVTMLAVGQEISDVPSSEGRKQSASYSTVTLSVTIDEAELLTIAQTRGKMTLLLRNREDVEVSTITKKTLREVLEDLEVIQEKRQIRIRKKPRKKVEKEKSIEIIAGDRK